MMQLQDTSMLLCQDQDKAKLLEKQQTDITTMKAFMSTEGVILPAATGYEVKMVPVLLFGC